MKVSIVILYILFSQVIFLNSVAQNVHLNFNLVKNPNGKPLGKINAITQDKNGYIWLAGSGDQCIYRYDGKKLIAFRQDSLNENSLGMKGIEKIYADDTGMIWIAGDGLDQYNTAKGVFKHFRHDNNDPGSIVDNGVMAILKDHQGRLWVGTNKGLDRLDEKTGKFIHYRSEENNPGSLSNDVVNTIYEDHNGVIWVGTGWRWFGYHKEEGGLNRLNADGSFTRYMHDPKNPHSLINNKVNAIFEDSRGVFWIGTNGFGLNIMDREKGRFEQLPNTSAKGDELTSLPFHPEAINTLITFIQEDSTGAIWFGTRGFGINRYDPVTQKINHFQNGNGFPDGSGWCAFTSRDGVLWIGSEEANFYRADPTLKKINSISIGPIGMVASDFLEGNNGNFWVGSDGAGLFQFDQNNNRLRQYNQEISKALSTPGSSISSMFQFDENAIWLGMLEGGILAFDTRTEKFSKFRYDRKPKDSMPNAVGSIVQDKDGFIWIARWSGLVRYTPKDGSIQVYHPNLKDTGAISTERISCAIQSRDGDIWVGGFGTNGDSGINQTGLNHLNKQTWKFKHYLMGLTIDKIYEDSDGNIWVSGDRKLYWLKNGENNFNPFFDASTEIHDARILGFVEDNDKNLWISTQSSIIKLNPARNKWYTYGSKFGVQPNNTSGAIYKLSNGRLLIGNTQGFYSFFPEELDVNTPPFKLNITELNINNLPVKPGDSTILQNPVETIKELTLNYDQNNFGFSFAGVDYKEPQANKYFTMLKGYDNTWREASTDNTANYFYVSPGSYTFRVKGINSDGTEGIREINIQILPPWWKTWWAYTLYGLLFFMIILFIYRIQKQRILHLERQKAQQIELAQAKEIEKAYHELRSTQALLIQSEKMASLGELTAGIAHEIQNPLNFVNNFSDINQELISELKEENEKGNSKEVNNIAENIKDNEDKINFHGKRADAIVKSMLQHSRTSTGQMEPVDINALADEYLRLAYHGLRAKEKSFNAILQTDYDPAVGKVNVISQDIGRLLLNLYNNAFYAVMEKQKEQDKSYEPLIIVSTKMEGTAPSRQVLVSIKDNGAGIPQKVLDKIFQPFFTTKPTGQGTGLGLSLSYDIIKAHNGEIKVDTREGEYTNFIISLPVA